MIKKLNYAGLLCNKKFHIQDNFSLVTLVDKINEIINIVNKK